jgi:hypothetical protein
MISIYKNGIKMFFQKKVKGKSYGIEFLKFLTFLFCFFVYNFLSEYFLSILESA